MILSWDCTWWNPSSRMNSINIEGASAVESNLDGRRGCGASVVTWTTPRQQASGVARCPAADRRGWPAGDLAFFFSSKYFFWKFPSKFFSLDLDAKFFFKFFQTISKFSVSVVFYQIFLFLSSKYFSLKFFCHKMTKSLLKREKKSWSEIDHTDASAWSAVN